MSTWIRLALRSVPVALLLLGCSGGDPSDPQGGSGELDRGPLGKADSSGSCVDHCGGKSSGTCWCDSTCATYGDCCEDADAVCSVGTGPKITFAEDYSESVSGELVRGAAVAIDYDEDRLTDCRGEQGGYLQWAITGFYRIDGGPVGTFSAAGNGAPHAPDLPTITLDRRGELELWFQNTNRWGCVAYDSDLGANYRFEVK